MSECWRCGKAVVEGAKFCASCGAPIGTTPPPASPPSPRSPEPADPLAQTAPADAAHLAELRKKFPVLAPKKDATTSPRSRGGTVPLTAQPDRVKRETPPPVTPAPATPTTPEGQMPVERRVARTVPDNIPTLPSTGGPIPGVPTALPSQPQVSPRAVSTFEPPLPAPAASQATSQPKPYAAPAPQPSYGAPQPPQGYGAQPQQAYGAPYGSPQGAPGAWQAPTQPGPYGSPPVPSQPTSVAVGARVFVEWSDGNRYQGTVQQCAPGQCLVLFQDGQQRWIDARRVIPT